MADDVPLNWQPDQIVADLYEVEDMTSGGMGVVYFVKHLKWGIKLAVKTPLPQIVSNESAMRRFIKEAETWVNLGLHPHIASCYYVRMMGGIPRIFIEYVDGGSLKEWIIGLEGYSHKIPPLFPHLPPDNKVVREKRREKERIIKRHLSAGPSLFPMSKEMLRAIGENLDLAIQICRGMQYVHEAGVIHRDLKPANCLITKAGTIKVTDFGIAKIGDDIDSISSLEMIQTGEESISITGSSFGTPEYMSPEQFLDVKHVGRESDIYSFGVMLYEMVCGKKPFVMPGTMLPVAREIFYRNAHLYEKPIAPVAIWSECHRGLNNLVLKCLEKNQENRPKSFSEIEEELLRIYGEITGELYLRQKPDKIKLRADALNNKALSLLDLGHEKEAEKCWGEALNIEPMHLASTFNNGYFLWQRGKIDPYWEYYYRIKTIEKNYSDNLEYFLSTAQIEVEMGLIEKGQDSGEKAISLGCDHKRLGDIFSKPSSFLVKTFKGNIAPVSSVAITSDGKFVISGSIDGLIKVWEVSSGECLHSYSGHDAKVSCVQITHDGEHFLSGSSDKISKAWNLQTGGCGGIFPNDHNLSGIASVAITKNKEYIASADELGIIIVWETRTGRCLGELKGHTNKIESLSIIDDDKFIISSSMDGTVRKWNIDDLKCTEVISGLMDEYQPSTVTHDGKFLLTESFDEFIRLWNIADKKCIKKIKTHDDSVADAILAISPDDRYAVSVNMENVVRLWDIIEGKLVLVLEGQKEKISSVSLAANGQYIAVGSNDKTVTLWQYIKIPRQFEYIISVPSSYRDTFQQQEVVKDRLRRAGLLIKKGQFRPALTILKHALQGKEITADPRILETIHNIGIQNGARQGIMLLLHSTTMETGKSSISFIDVSKDGDIVISGSGDGVVDVWDVASSKHCNTNYWSSHHSGISALAISDDKKYIASGGFDNFIILWEMKTGEVLQFYPDYKKPVKSLAFSHDGKYLISGSEWDRENTLRLWDLSTEECVISFEDPHSDISSVALSTVNKLVVSGSSNGEIKLWDLSTGKCLQTLLGHNSDITGLTMGTDKRLLISNSNDGTARIWDTESGKCNLIIDDSDSYFFTSLLTTDKKNIVTVNLVGTVKLWDVKTGKILDELQNNINSISGVSALRLTSDARYVYCGKTDGKIEKWEIVWDWEFPNGST